MTIEPSLKRFSQAAGIVAILAGGIVLTGWFIDSPVLKGIRPDWAPMKANTALCFILAGLSLLFLRSEVAGTKRRRLGQFCAIIIIAVAFLTLGEELLGWNLGIDRFLLEVPSGETNVSPPGRMSPVSACNFVLLGLALLLLDYKTVRGHELAGILALAAGVISLFVFVGYTYQQSSLRMITSVRLPAWFSVLAFLIVSMGVLFARPNRGLMALFTGLGLGSVLARRLLPAAVGLTLVLGWLRLEGQKAGLYDTAFGTSLYAVVMAVIFGALTLATARMLNRMDALRKRTEETLRTSEERFRSVTETAHDAIVMADQKGAIVLWNKGAETIFGYSAEEVLGQPLTLIMPERYRDGHRKGLQHFLQTGEARVIGKTVELHGRRKDGGEFPLELSLTSWKTGEDIFFSGIIRDITERKRSEEALRDSEQRHRLLFDENPLPAWVFDLETLSFLAVNEAAVRHYGFSREEFLKMTIKDIRPAEDIPALLERVSKLKNGAHHPGEWRHRKKDGTIINVEIVSHLLNFGEKPAELVLVNDITERKRAEETLRKSEEKYRVLFDSIDVGVCTIEVLFDGNDKPVDYRFLEVNSSFEKQTGIQNAPGRRMREIAPRHEEHWFEIYGKIALSGKPARFENEATQLHRWYDVYAFRVGEPEKRQVAIHFKDITERKRVEEEIQKLNESLRLHAAQLEAANKELEAFSYSVSHDLRAPLRSIDGFSQAVMEDSSEKLDEQGKDYLGRVRTACHRMAQLIDDLLNLSRVSRGEMRMETIDLSGMAREIVSELQRQAPERKVTFVIADNLISKGDPRLLRIALENLLGNAWKYTSKHPAARIEFGANRQADGKTAFYVRDDGAGFDMAYAGKLFGAFQRLHGPAEFAGTGVGLATVQRILHRHGGRVWAEGAVEQGATFYFKL